MRRSPCQVQFLDAAAAMSSRRPYRGDRGRGRRSFSNRSPNVGVNDQMLAGDSHFESVSDANLGFRHGGQGGRGGFSNLNQRSYPPPHFNHNPSFRQPPPPHVNHNPSFRQPPPSRFNHNPSFRQPPPPNFNHSPNFRQSLPPFDRRQQPFPQHNPVPFDRNQSGRPVPQHHSRPPKPLDYREWEFSKTAPPSGSERFLVLSYNVLADYLAINHRSKLYYHIPRHMLDWEWRSRRIMFELSLWSADIMCLQEVDRFQDLEEELKHRGYSGVWKMRTGNAVDGCAIFWRTSRFKLVHEESIEFNKLGLRDNVAQICVLEQVNGNAIRDEVRDEVVSPASSAGSDRIVICNIHVLYNPKRGDYKLGQVRTLLDRANAVSSVWNNASIVLCGDFNCTPKSPLYNFIKDQKLDLSGVDRDKVSGQASAEIRPSRPYNPKPGFQPADHLAQAQSPAVAQEFNLGTSNSGPDTQGESNSNTNRENVSSANASVLECSNNLGSDVASHLDQPTSNEIPHSNSNQGAENQERDSSGDTHVAEDVSSVDRSNQENISCQTIKIECLLNERLNDLSLSEPTESVNRGETMVEDDNTFLSALHDDNSAQLLKPDQLSNTEISVDDPVHLLSEASNFEETTYDPALWTPAEIATATGNPDSKLMEHPLQLKSTYTEVEDLSNTRDSNGEPMVTSYNRCFMGTVDYIWRSEGLQTVRVLAPIPKHAMQWTPGFPTKKWGSDHIALASELAFVKDQSCSGDT